MVKQEYKTNHEGVSKCQSQRQRKLLEGRSSLNQKYKAGSHQEFNSEIRQFYGLHNALHKVYVNKENVIYEVKETLDLRNDFLDRCKTQSQCLLS